MNGRAVPAAGDPEPAVGPGDEQRFALLYPSLRRFAGAIASRDVDPDDLVQEAVVRVLRAGGLGRLDDPGAYLRRTMINIETAHRRRQARQRSRQTVAGLASELVGPVYPSDLAWLDVLGPVDRAALYLSAVDAMPSREIAEALGLTDVAVRLRLSRARRRLQRVVREEGSG